MLRWRLRFAVGSHRLLIRRSGMVVWFGIARSSLVHLPPPNGGRGSVCRPLRWRRRWRQRWRQRWRRRSGRGGSIVVSAKIEPFVVERFKIRVVGGSRVWIVIWFPIRLFHRHRPRSLSYRQKSAGGIALDSYICLARQVEAVTFCSAPIAQRQTMQTDPANRRRERGMLATVYRLPSTDPWR